MVKLTLDKLLDDRGITRYELEKVTGIKLSLIHISEPTRH